MSKSTIGIDLGTTNTCAAYITNKTPHIIPTFHNTPTFPSTVSLIDRKVGINTFNKNNTVYAVKRLIGRKYTDILQYCKNLPYKISPSHNNDIYIKYGKHNISPVEISAIILQHVKDYSQKYLQSNIQNAVITVPAYFDDTQRQATKDAGKIAGLNVLRVINEPTAAALAYGLQKKDKSIVVVYDFGGGTFDVSVLMLNDGVFEVVSTNGNVSLGGEDIDNCIRNKVIEKFEAEHNVKLDCNSKFRLKEHVERMKKELSDSNESTIEIPDFIKKDGKLIGMKYKYTRHEIENWVRHIVEQTINPCLLALKDAKISADKIDHVILVGGTTRMPLVKQVVQKIFNKVPESSVDPDTVVAKGAAIQAGIIEGEYNEIVLLDVNSLSLGIETVGGIFNKIIKRNTTLPTKMTETFTTSEDDQTEVTIKIYQGERPLVKHNKLLGEIKLIDIPKMKKGQPRIEVTFEGDTNGIYNVTAKDALLNKEQKMEIKPASGLSKEEIENIIEIARKEEKMDKKRMECAKVRTEIERIIGDKNEDRDLMELIRDDVFDIEKAKKMMVKILDTK